jgi:hypothetical protein
VYSTAIIQELNRFVVPVVESALMAEEVSASIISCRLHHGPVLGQDTRWVNPIDYLGEYLELAKCFIVADSTVEISQTKILRERTLQDT